MIPSHHGRHRLDHTTVKTCTLLDCIKDPAPLANQAEGAIFF